MSIFDYYKSLSYKEKRAFKKQVMERCDFSYPSFDVKIRKDTWKKLEREAVEQIIREGHD